ncbi:WYL domain-containing protein [Streptomyces roseolilacinus]
MRAVDSTATAVGDDGWVEAVIPVEGTEHACGELLRLGGDVEVMAPAELRQAMAATVGVLARAYEDEAPGGGARAARDARHGPGDEGGPGPRPAPPSRSG